MTEFSFLDELSLSFDFRVIRDIHPKLSYYIVLNRLYFGHFFCNHADLMLKGQNKK